MAKCCGSRPTWKYELLECGHAGIVLIELMLETYDLLVTHADTAGDT
jgi:hypothetical protein